MKKLKKWQLFSIIGVAVVRLTQSNMFIMMLPRATWSPS